VVNAKSQLWDPFAYRGRRRILSAWAMAIVFATVAVVSFAVDQTVSLSPTPEEQTPPSLLNPAQLIQSLVDAAAE
jgi:hypothetical protein